MSEKDGEKLENKWGKKKENKEKENGIRYKATIF
jgi:hypothetical protein